jgi:hypothetical protein
MIAIAAKITATLKTSATTTALPQSRALPE